MKRDGAERGPAPGAQREVRGPVLPVPRARGSGRRADIDWLRVGAILLVFLTHSAQVFSPIDDWHIQNPEPSWWLGQFTVFMAPWLMPLFMLVAGMSAWYALRRRDPGLFLRERVFKLFVPLVAGTLLVVPPQMYVRRVSRGEFEGTYLEFYPHFFDGVYPTGNFSYGHLWFLAYLFAYMFVGLPIFTYLRSAGGRALMRRVAGVCRLPGGILWLFVPFAVGQMALRPFFPQTTGALIGDWATHAWFFPAYLLGYVIMAERRFQASIRRVWGWALLPAALTSLGLFLFAAAGDVYGRIPVDPTIRYAVFWTGFMLGCWSWLVFLLGAARRFLSRPTAFLQYAHDRIYPFYVFHQTAIVVVASSVVGWPLGIGAKFAVIVFLAMVGTVALLELVNRVPGLRSFFGLRGGRPPPLPGP